MNLIIILISILIYISKIICEDACQRRECVTECDDFGYSLTNNCQTCHCNQRRDCPPVRCIITCKFGRKKDANGCEYCRCQDPCTEGIHLKQCPDKHYCKADFQCNRDYCKIRTRCIKIGKFGTEITTPSSDSFRPSINGIPGQPGNPDSTGQNDRTRGVFPPNPPAPIPSPTMPTAGIACKCPKNSRKCDCTTIMDTEKQTHETKESKFYSSDTTPDISTKHKIPQISHNFGKVKADESLHFPTIIYATLASVLGASIIGIIILTIILYRRRYPKEIDIQEEELTKERESVSSSEADPQRIADASKLATQV